MEQIIFIVALGLLGIISIGMAVGGVVGLIDACKTGRGGENPYIMLSVLYGIVIGPACLWQAVSMILS